MVGTDKADVIRGTAGHDVIVAKRGADKIYGRGGDDVICAGQGRDTAKGGGGRDRIFGGVGRDTLAGGSGYDLLDGRADKDACHTGADGAKLRDCEEADLKVRVVSAVSMVEGEDVRFDIKVKSIGTKPIRFDLEIADIQTDLSCTQDETRTLVNQRIGAGGHLSYAYWHPCDIDGVDPHETLTATVKTTAPEDDPSNDSDSSTTQVVAP